MQTANRGKRRGRGLGSHRTSLLFGVPGVGRQGAPGARSMLGRIVKMAFRTARHKSRLKPSLYWFLYCGAGGFACLLLCGAGGFACLLLLWDRRFRLSFSWHVAHSTPACRVDTFAPVAIAQAPIAFVRQAFRLPSTPVGQAVPPVIFVRQAIASATTDPEPQSPP
jgi:hypothetical protein